MINWLKILLITFLCLLITETYLFAHHYKEVVDDDALMLTYKRENYKNTEDFKFPKIKNEARKKHCTTAKSVTAKYKENGEPPFKEDGSIDLIIKFYHFEAKHRPVIEFKRYENVFKKHTIKPLTDYTVDDFLRIYFCLGNADRKLILETNDLDKETIISDDLIKKNLTIPDGVKIKAPYFSIASPIKTQGDKVKPIKVIKEKFKEDLRDKLLDSVKEKLGDFDNKILEVDEKLNIVNGQLITLRKDYNDIKKSVENTLDVTFNKNIPEIREKYLQLKELNESVLNEKEIKEIESKLNEHKKTISDLEDSKTYKKIKDLKLKFDKAKKNKDLKRANGEYYSVENIDDMKSINTENISENIDRASNKISLFNDKIQEIGLLRKEIDVLDMGANKKSTSDLILEYIVYIVIALFVVAVITFIYLQSRKIKKLSKMSQTAESKFTDMEDKLRSTSAKIRASRDSRRGEKLEQPSEPVEAPKTPQQIKIEKFNDLVRDYDEAREDFSKIAGFKQKWNGVAVSRKERQEGSKTVLVHSGRAFEKSEIWCVGFDDKTFAFPGSSVYSKMSTYMNLDFEKAHRDFKGIFNISSGSNYSVEPSVIRKGGAGYVVERAGKIQFPR